MKKKEIPGSDKPGKEKKYQGQDGKKSFRDDKKPSYKRTGNDEDRPKRTFDRTEKPKRSFGSDKREGNREDRPKRSYSANEGGERPKRSFADKREGDRDDRPKRSFAADKSSRDERPKRSFDKEKGKGKWEDRPKREDAGNEKPYHKKEQKSFGKAGGKFKPSFKKKEEEKPFPFGDRKVSGPFRKNYQEKQQSKPERPERKRKVKEEEEEVKNLTLNTYIAHSGVCSRRDAADLVKQGKVKVNDELVLDPGYRVQEYDQVTIAGKKLAPQKDRVYILLNKPKDYITTTDDPEGRKTVMELVANSGHSRLFPVGRLDRQTTGLLLLTNDGELAQKLSHPSFETKKVYQVTLDKSLTKAHFEQIVAGVELEDGMAHVDALAYLESKNELGLEIHSGRNRIVRRIFESLGYAVEKLDRVMYAGLTKKNLPRGKWRFLQEKEVILLKHFKI